MGKNMKASKEKQSSVIKPGTGSGSRPNASKIKIEDSQAKDSHKLHREPSGGKGGMLK